MRKVIALLLGLSVIGFGIGHYLLSPYYNCGYSTYCSNLLDRSLSLYFSTRALAIVFAVLFIFPHAFKAWRNFALWFLPLAIDIFVSYTGPGRGYIDITPDSVTMFKWIGWVYVCISIVIIAFSVFNRKYGKEVTLKISSKRQKIIFWSLWVLYVAILIGLHFFD